MSKQPPKAGQPWSDTEKQQLRQLANQNTPTRVIALKLGRTAEAVQAQAQRQGTSLKPTNQSPYNRRKD